MLASFDARLPNAEEDQQALRLVLCMHRIDVSDMVVMRPKNVRQVCNKRVSSVICHEQKHELLTHDRTRTLLRAPFKHPSWNASALATTSSPPHQRRRALRHAS